MSRFGQDATGAAPTQNVASRLSSSMDAASDTPSCATQPRPCPSIHGHSPVAACASSSHANRANTAASRIPLSPRGRDRIELREVHIGKTLDIFRRLPVGSCNHRRKRTQSCLAAPCPCPRKHDGGTAPPSLLSSSVVPSAISRRYPSSTTR